MGLIVSAVLVMAGAIMIGAVDGSVRGIEANTIGGVLVLLGLVSALALLVIGAAIHEATTFRPEHDEDEPTPFSRR